MTRSYPRRRLTRLGDYDYAQPGAYFITVSAERRSPVFGEIRRRTMEVNRAGEIVRRIWQSLPGRFPGLDLDEFVVMPDHLHGILVLSGADAMNRAPTLGKVVRVFKAASARTLHLQGTPDFAWQRNYYEHVVRNEADLRRIRQYILDNPAIYGLKQQEPLDTRAIGQPRA